MSALYDLLRFMSSGLKGNLRFNPIVKVYWHLIDSVSNAETGRGG